MLKHLWRVMVSLSDAGSEAANVAARLRQRQVMGITRYFYGGTAPPPPPDALIRSHATSFVLGSLWNFVRNHLFPSNFLTASCLPVCNSLSIVSVSKGNRPVSGWCHAIAGLTSYRRSGYESGRDRISAEVLCLYHVFGRRRFATNLWNAGMFPAQYSTLSLTR